MHQTLRKLEPETDSLEIEKMRNLTAGLSLSFFAAIGCTADSHQELRRLLKVDAVLDSYHTECLEGKGVPTAVELIEANPDYFGGVTPSSSKWPAVEAAYNDYTDDICSYFSKKEAADVYYKALVDGMSADELNELQRFLSSPVGIKYINSTLDGNKAMQAYLQEQSKRKTAEALTSFSERLGKILSN